MKQPNTVNINLQLYFVSCAESNFGFVLFESYYQSRTFEDEIFHFDLKFLKMKECVKK